jgi:hypothetical protein
MAFMFTHCYIAEQVLKKLKKKKLISSAGKIDDYYFQAEAHSFSPLQYLLNLSQSNQHNLLFDLDFNPLEVTSYRVGSLLYLREPGIDTINIFSFITFNLEEKAVRSILNQKPNLTSFLRKFKKESIKRCVDSLEEKL